jgi:OOP family OmpA-OmpF porin
MKKVTILFAFGTLLAMATVASAANKAETFSISPMIGGITFEGKQHLETNPVYGVRLGYNFTKELGVEALFDYAHTEPTLTGGKVDFYRYGGELLYHFFPDNAFVPHVAAGYAAVDFKGSVPLASSSYTAGAFDYGVGAKYFITDAIALRGDVRHLIYRFNGTQQAVEYVVGLYIPFGGVKPAAKAVEPAPAPVAEPVVAPVPAPVAPPPAAAPSANLTITPTSITKGGAATLNWTSQNASKCVIQPAVGSVEPQGSLSVTPADNTSYALTCEGADGVATSAP